MRQSRKTNVVSKARKLKQQKRELARFAKDHGADWFYNFK